MMKVAFAGTGVMLSDGATNIMPVAPHRGDRPAPTQQAREPRRGSSRVAAARRRRPALAGQRLLPGLGPPPRAAADALRRGLRVLPRRPRAGGRAADATSSNKAAQATLVGDVFDDAATGQGLLNYFLRGIACGAVDRAGGARDRAVASRRSAASRSKRGASALLLAITARPPRRRHSPTPWTGIWRRRRPRQARTSPASTTASAPGRCRPRACRPARPGARRTTSARPAGARQLARRAGEGVRQPVLRRPDRVFGLGVTTSAGIIVVDTIFDYSVEDEVVGGLKKLGLDPGDDQVRDRQPRPRRSLGRREVPAGSFRHAHHPVRRGLGSARSQQRHEADARHGRDRRPEAHARRHDRHDVHHAGAYATERSRR